MPRVFGYIRVSTRDQEDSGLGLEAQRDAIRRAFEYKWKPAGYDWAEIYEDRAVSGKVELTSRKAGQRLSLETDSGDVVIFAKLDRGFRNTVDLLTTIEVWKGRGVRAVFLDADVDSMSPVGEVVLGVLAIFAQFERRRIGERTREAQVEMRRKGKRVGRPPFGIRIMGQKGARRMEAHPDIYPVQKWIVQCRLKGHSWEAIELHLRGQGITRPGPKGSKLPRPWSVMAVRRAYKSFLKILGWIEEGKVQLPKGLEK